MYLFDATVIIMLSSITEFMDSIQFASRLPSSIIHLGFSSGIPDKFLIMFERSPSCHSLVARLIYPYSSLILTALGFKSITLVGSLGLENGGFLDYF